MRDWVPAGPYRRLRNTNRTSFAQPAWTSLHAGYLDFFVKIGYRAGVPGDQRFETSPTGAPPKTCFVAINYITCRPDYADRFESLFASRAHAIDRMPGFLGMEVLKCTEGGRPYLVISRWKDEQSFKAWVGSPEFHEGHKRAFDDLRQAKERGEQPPMSSDFLTYEILTH